MIRPIHRQNLLLKEAPVRFRNLFRRSASSGTEPSPITGSFQHEQASAEELAELEEAWADLNQAADEAGVITFRACTRDGSPWQNDPEAVRMVSAMIRDSHNQDQSTATG